MDLKEGWEKKALIGVGIAVSIIIIYSYFIPYYGTPEPSLQPNQTSISTVTPLPYAVPTTNNSTTNNSTTNVTLTADQAKNIAHNAYPNFNIGTPTYQNNLNINGTIYSAWVIPITLNGTKKTVYIDNSGAIIQTN